MKVVRLEAHDVLRIHAICMGRPIAVARLRAPFSVAAVGRAGVLGGVAAPGAVRERHVADAVKQVAMMGTGERMVENVR